MCIEGCILLVVCVLGAIFCWWCEYWGLYYVGGGVY